MIREGIQKLIEGIDLTFEESDVIMREVMSGKATNAQTAAFLTALRMKGESVEELIAFTSVMRSNCCTIHPKVQGRLVDTCLLYTSPSPRDVLLSIRRQRQMCIRDRRMKGESVEELIAFTSVMRSNCCTIHPKVQGRLVDTCGTGGDKIKTFN